MACLTHTTVYSILYSVLQPTCRLQEASAPPSDADHVLCGDMQTSISIKGMEESLHHCTCRATRDPAAPEAINQYDPIFVAPTGNFTPWQIHISPADATFQHMFVVYATGKYITGLNKNGGLCETVTFQQACKPALSFMHTSRVHLLIMAVFRCMIKLQAWC